MKILFWSELYWPDIGGLEILSLQLLRELKARGHEITVICSHGGRDLPDVAEVDGIRVHRFRFVHALERSDLKEIKNIVERLIDLIPSISADLFHLNAITPLFFYLRARRVMDAPILFTIHNSLEMLPYSSENIVKFFDSVSWATAVSQSVFQAAEKSIAGIGSRFSVLYNGLKMPSLAPEPISFSPPVFLCYGRVIPQKGFDVALNAFARVHREHPEARLIFAGDGVLLDSMKELARALEIDKQVDFMGWVHPEKIYALINQSSAVIVPSRYQEPFGLVALEAAQMARPVIASRVGGLPEVVVDQQSGYLYENEDAGELAERMLQLIENPALAAELGQGGRKRAEREFDFGRMVDAYERLYYSFVPKNA